MTLILRRKPGESVIVTLPDGRQMRVKVHADAYCAVRLLFDAPEDVVIMREELLDRIVGTYAGTYADWEGKK